MNKLIVGPLTQRWGRLWRGHSVRFDNTYVVALGMHHMSHTVSCNSGALYTHKIFTGFMEEWVTRTCAWRWWLRQPCLAWRTKNTPPARRDSLTGVFSGSGWWGAGCWVRAWHCKVMECGSYCLWYPYPPSRHPASPPSSSYLSLSPARSPALRRVVFMYSCYT